MDERSAQAMIRFGLGRRRDETPPGDPAAWLRGQLRGPDPARFADLPSTGQALSVLREQRREEREAKAETGKPLPGPRPAALLFRADAAAQLLNALTSPAPFRERLVMFWTNHFTVSLRQGGTAPVIGPFIREAIRPHVTGRFADMLLAVMRHPAMLMYLDNAGSVGPDSVVGQRQHRGLNENLARESLELHTVTPAAGYSQADVTSYANILTGWSVEMKADPPGFMFRPNTHEPGAKVLLGQSFPPGQEGGMAALVFLANHPSTHRALARKLVCHFVADEPPGDCVARIEGVLRDSGGDLGAASTALVSLPQAWVPLRKLRTPQEYTIATLRALDLPADNQPDMLGVMAMLGQPLWNAPLPNGWSDRAADWVAPEDLLRRADWAYGVSARAADLDPVEVGQAALGPLLRPATLDAMQHAGSRRDAMTLLLSSPEFMRR